jgi:uncharacterized protein
MTAAEGDPEEATPGVDEPDRPLARLLEVQQHDTAVDQLRHRRATLPDRAQLAEVEGQLRTLETRSSEVRKARDEYGSRQATLEQQIEAARSRRSALEKRLYGGQVAAARDLQAMNEEVRHLGRHISDLEDREIEVMEALEPLDDELRSAEDRRAALDDESARLRSAIAGSEVALDAQIAEQSAARAEVAQTVRADLLARYEQLRTKLGGTGAAQLTGGSCGGCHLALPAMELDRIRKAPPDAVITCDQCGRILVR